MVLDSLGLGQRRMARLPQGEGSETADTLAFFSLIR